MLRVSSFKHTDYLAILKWKQGERAALSTFRAGPSRLHVLFEMPPAGDYDHETRRPLTPTEHIKLFGKKLYDAWGNRVAFIDASNIDDDLHKKGFARHPLTELLERARLAGASACPAVSPTHSEEYRKAVKRFVEWHADFPVCIRVETKHLDSPTFHLDLERLIQELNCRPSKCFVVLDFKNLELPSVEAEDSFGEMLADRLADFPFLHEWSGIAVALSSFPTDLKMRPGEIKQFPRTDLPVYRKLISNPKALLRTPMFGDYAVDTSPIVKPQRRTPSAHFRYSTPTGYAIAKGTTVKKPHGYEAIYPVADLLASQPFFMGSAFSEGDEFIVSLQRRAPAKGNAATWRWASTDHHLTCNVGAIAEMYGLAPIEEKALSQTAPKQLEFLYADDNLTSAPATVTEREE